MLTATQFNPDVLSCLANLSSDEVFTPPKLANEILDLLPSDLWLPDKDKRKEKRREDLFSRVTPWGCLPEREVTADDWYTPVAIIELVVGGAPGDPSLAALMDLNMHTLVNGRERTLHEFDGLLDRAGLRRIAVVSTGSPQSVIEAVAA